MASKEHPGVGKRTGDCKADAGKTVHADDPLAACRAEAYRLMDPRLPESQRLSAELQVTADCAQQEQQRVKEQTESTALQALIKNIPALARDAAHQGRTSVEIMKVGTVTGDVFVANPAPNLTAAQKAVFDGIKDLGLNPTLEMHYHADTATLVVGAHENAWVIKANWQ